MTNNLECKDCCYFWKEDGEPWPGCHWEERCPGDLAPCEEDDYWDDEDDWEYYVTEDLYDYAEAEEE